MDNTANRRTISQFIKYACVGVMNTLITLVVILMCKDILSINEWLSNAIGYVVGFINSFLWNKHWVFKSHRKMTREITVFCIGFLICYGIQFCVTWVLAMHTPLNDVEVDIMGLVLSGYGIATVIGMGVYTVANFMYNKVITFRGE